MRNTENQIASAGRRSGRPQLPSHRLVVRDAHGAPGHMRHVVSTLLNTFDCAPEQTPDGQGKEYIIGETSNVCAQRRDVVARGFVRADIFSEG